MVKQDIGLFEHRGIVISIESDDENATLTYFARAGGRSLITMGWTGDNVMAKVINTAHRKIDEAYEGRTEKMALWINDTTHWMSENPNVVVPTMLSIKGISAVLEEVLKQATGITPQLRAKAQNVVDRIKQEL